MKLSNLEQNMVIGLEESGRSAAQPAVPAAGFAAPSGLQIRG